MEWLLSGKPYTVQSKALEICGQRRGFAYFMEMGLGKTAVVLAEFKWLLQQGEVDVLAIVCPPTLRRNWLNELDKWDTGLKGAYWNKGKVKGGYFPDKTPVVAMNYEAFSGGRCVGLDFLMAIAKSGRRVMLVLDESVQVKGHTSIRTKNLMALAPFMQYVRVLSGAPCTQGPSDLWAQLRMIGAAKGHNFYTFRNRYCKMGGFMNKQIVGSKNEEELHALLTEWGFRAKKKDWTDLPEKLPAINRYNEMLPAQLKAYEEMEDDFVTYVMGEAVEAGIVITQLLKLQQISSGFIIDGDGKEIDLVPTPPKLDDLHDAMEEIEGKMLIFTHFRYTTTQLHTRLRDDFNPAIMIGGMGDEAIEAEKKKFAEDPTCRQFIIQDATGKYGHTLLGNQKVEREACHTSYFYENGYSLDTRLQAEDRNHRHGQTYPVGYFDSVSSSVEEKAITALQRKQDVADAVVDGIRKEKG